MEKINLSVIIPVYNEEKTIEEIIRKVAMQKGVHEIIVIDDGSTDSTRELLAKIPTGSNLKVIHHSKNEGKGKAVRDGLAQATGNYLIIQDADLEYSPDDYPKLIKPILEEKAQIVYGSRFLNQKTNMLWWIFLGNKFLTYCLNLLFGAKLTDMTTCYKLIPLPLLKKLNLKSKKFEIDLELTAALLKKGYKIHEVPIDYKGRKYSEGKKITWFDGLRDIFLMFKYKFQKF